MGVPFAIIFLLSVFFLLELVQSFLFSHVVMQLSPVPAWCFPLCLACRVHKNPSYLALHSLPQFVCSLSVSPHSSKQWSLSEVITPPIFLLLLSRLECKYCCECGGDAVLCVLLFVCIPNF